MSDNRAVSALRQGIVAAKAGLRSVAQQRLSQAAEAIPDDPTVWVWLAAVAESPANAMACLNTALSLDPHSALAHSGMQWFMSLNDRGMSSIDAPAHSETVPAPALESAQVEHQPSEPAPMPLWDVAHTPPPLPTINMATVDPSHSAAQNLAAARLLGEDLPAPMTFDVTPPALPSISVVPAIAAAGAVAAVVPSVAAALPVVAEPEARTLNFVDDLREAMSARWDALSNDAASSGESHGNASNMNVEKSTSTADWTPAPWTEGPRIRPLQAPPIAPTLDRSPSEFRSAALSPIVDIGSRPVEIRPIEPSFSPTPKQPPRDAAIELRFDESPRITAEASEPSHSWSAPSVDDASTFVPPAPLPPLDTPSTEFHDLVERLRSSPSSATKATVLVVDDSPTVRKLVAMTLERDGYRVCEASDGVAAIKEIAAIMPGLVLLDISMPKLDGYKLCRLVKGHDATRHIPVVMLSGKDGTFDKLRGRLAGCSDYITKPFDPETLLKKVERHVLTAAEAR